MMMRKLYCVIIAAFINCFPSHAPAQTQKSAEIKIADDLFQIGKFNEAQTSYRHIFSSERKNFEVLRSLGTIALLNNQLNEARKWLDKALAVKPDDKQTKSLLAEVFYRQGDFQRAVPLLRGIGREAAAKELESFQEIAPYQIDGKLQMTSVKFVSTDLLPVIKVKVNESEEVNFIIDTGGSEIILDPTFAERLKVPEFGTETGKAFAGGKQADYKLGRIDLITLGDFKIRNVPVHIQGTRQFSAAAGGKQIDGVLGTVLLYHFLSTLDYTNGELILRRKTKQNAKRLMQETSSQKEIAIPFWMAGDHYMVARGSVNNNPPLLFLVDTGLAGGGFACPDSTIKEAGIKLMGQASEGIGGGGKVRAVPFKLDDLSLGDAEEKNIIGFAGVFPPTLENQFGFRIGGLISHQFFRPYALTIDFADMKLILKRGTPR